MAPLRRSEDRISSYGLTHVTNQHVVASNTMQERGRREPTNGRSPPRHVASMPPRAGRNTGKRRADDRDDSSPLASPTPKRRRPESHRAADETASTGDMLPPALLPTPRHTPAPEALPAFDGPLAGFDVASLTEFAVQHHATSTRRVEALSMALNRLQNVAMVVARHERDAHTISGGLVRAMVRVRELHANQNKLEREWNEYQALLDGGVAGHDDGATSQRIDRPTTPPNLMAPPSSPIAPRSPPSSPVARRRPDTPRPIRIGSSATGLPSIPSLSVRPPAPELVASTYEEDADLQAAAHSAALLLTAASPTLTDEQAREYIQLLANEPTQAEIASFFHQRGIPTLHSGPAGEDLGPLPGSSRGHGTSRFRSRASPSKTKQPTWKKDKGKARETPISLLSPPPPETGILEGAGQGTTHRRLGNRMDSELQVEEVLRLPNVSEIFERPSMVDLLASQSASTSSAGGPAPTEEDTEDELELRKYEAIVPLDIEENQELKQIHRKLEFFDAWLARSDRDTTQELEGYQQTTPSVVREAAEFAIELVVGLTQTCSDVASAMVRAASF